MTDKRLLLPCLRGAFGRWVTYTALMRLNDIASLISFADDIHKSKKLSDMIQRQLLDDRAKEISDYILDNEERFFNSIVVAVYDGKPKWHELDALHPTNEEALALEIPDYANESMGFLSLSREEKIFALDGQHRLSGIKRAVKKSNDVGFEQIPVVFVSHINTEEGIRRSRRLFTTLNKKAKPVNKAAIIALDEDDLAACITRYAVENGEYLNESNIRFIGSNNIPMSDESSITTIANLYDFLKIIISHKTGHTNRQIENFTGSNERKSYITSYCTKIIEKIFESFPPLSEYIKTSKKDDIVRKYRNRGNGGHLIFRPVGWVYIANLVQSIVVSKPRNQPLNDDRDKEVLDLIGKLGKIDLGLEGEVLNNTVWSASEKKMNKQDAALKRLVIKNITCQLGL